jgi:hypothetical protein
MFTIHYVVVAEGKSPDVIERMVLKHTRLTDADAAARSLISGVRARWPETPPNGYLILDERHRVVIRCRGVVMNDLPARR